MLSPPKYIYILKSPIFFINDFKNLEFPQYSFYNWLICNTGQSFGLFLSAGGIFYKKPRFLK